MRSHLDRLGDAHVAVVFFDRLDHLGEHRRRQKVPTEVALLADPERRAYAAFEVGRGSWRRVWGLRTLRAYARLVRQGERVHRHEGDSLQMGADFVIGADGRLLAAFYPEHPDDRPDLAQIVAALG